MKAAEMEQPRKVGTRLRSSLWNGSRHIQLPVMCNVYRVTLISNGVKKGATKPVHVVCQTSINHGLKGNVNYWCITLIPLHYRICQRDTNYCLKSRASAKKKKKNAHPDIGLVWVVKQHLWMEKGNVTWRISGERVSFLPRWISVVATPANKSQFAAISYYIKGHLDLYQCAIHEAWHCNILTAEKNDPQHHDINNTVGQY